MNSRTANKSKRKKKKIQGHKKKYVHARDNTQFDQEKSREISRANEHTNIYNKKQGIVHSFGVQQQLNVRMKQPLNLQMLYTIQILKMQIHIEIQMIAQY